MRVADKLQLHSQSWRNGYTSNVNGVRREANPYNYGSKHRLLWYQGWDECLKDNAGG